jgi:hypothetical protein
MLLAREALPVARALPALAGPWLPAMVRPSSPVQIEKIAAREVQEALGLLLHPAEVDQPAYPAPSRQTSQLALPRQVSAVARFEEPESASIAALGFPAGQWATSFVRARPDRARAALPAARAAGLA